MVFEGRIQVAPWWMAGRRHGIHLSMVCLEGSSSDITGIGGFIEETVLKKKKKKKKRPKLHWKGCRMSVSVDHPQQIQR